MMTEQLGKSPLDNEDMGWYAYCHLQEFAGWELHSEGVFIQTGYMPSKDSRCFGNGSGNIFRD
jgi:hypothetical protein